METVKERPILMNTAMVQAVLNNQKFKTRRILKIPSGRYKHSIEDMVEGANGRWWNGYAKCPYGRKGDQLWVRETWRKRYSDANESNKEDSIQYKADGLYLCEPGWKPSIHMYRWMSRINLKINNIRVERVQDISEDDAEAEGIDFLRHHPDSDETLTAIQLFSILWDSINDKRGYGWKSNPWVWVVEFKLLTD